MYCGTGTITQIVAKHFPESSVTGVELIESAVSDARINAEKNMLQNVEFLCMDTKLFFREHSLKKRYDILITDPPRAGIAPKTLRKMLLLNCPKIVYVSCNPVTLSRDTEQILAEGYSLEKISIIDQFPHTSHIECVALFKKSQ